MGLNDSLDELDLSSGEQSFGDESDFVGEKPKGQRPTRHQTTYYKMLEWSVEIKKPILIIGDSNLSRIPEYDYPSVQIDSFPGAQILHIK